MDELQHIPPEDVQETVPAQQDQNDNTTIPEHLNLEEPAKYTFKELVDAAEAAFKEKQEVVAAALKLKKIETATKKEAAAIIKEFKERKVK